MHKLAEGAKCARVGEVIGQIEAMVLHHPDREQRTDSHQARPPRERRSDRPARHDRRDRDEPVPMGLGDHVPAFLARPTR